MALDWRHNWPTCLSADCRDATDRPGDRETNPPNLANFGRAKADSESTHAGPEALGRPATPHQRLNSEARALRERTRAAAFRNLAGGGQTPPSSPGDPSNSPRGESRAGRESFSESIFPRRRRDLITYPGARGCSCVASELTEGFEDFYGREFWRFPNSSSGQSTRSRQSGMR
jgi:hypothetical protein